eukprot:5241283-Alexandrium_andersonii.AAC.1
MPSPALHTGVPTRVQAKSVPVLHARIALGHVASDWPGRPASKALYLLLLLDLSSARLPLSARAAGAP